MSLRWSIMLVSAFTCGHLACDDASKEPSANISLSVLSFQPGLEACFSLALSGAEGAVTFSGGAPDLEAATVADARAAGALCGKLDAGINTEVPCTPGASRATLHVVGVWDGAEKLTEYTEYEESCGFGGCFVDFTCREGVAAEASFELQILPPSYAGYLDLAFSVPPPEGAPELCYGFRILNGAGELVMATSDACSSRFGNGSGGAVSYVAPCDAKPGLEDNIFTWWVHAPEGVSGWTHPCLAPDDAPEDVADWTGGCAISQRCVLHADTPIVVGGDE